MQCQLACDIANERANLPDGPLIDGDFGADFRFVAEDPESNANGYLSKVMRELPNALYGRQCAGFELSPIKKKRYKCTKTEKLCSAKGHEACGAHNYCQLDAQGEKLPKRFNAHRCELHFSPITHSAKGSRYCKRAKCHARKKPLYGVLQVPAFANDPIIDLKFGMEEDPANYENSIVIPVTPGMPDCPAFVSMEDSKWHELVVVRTVNESASTPPLSEDANVDLSFFEVEDVVPIDSEAGPYAFLFELFGAAADLLGLGYESSEELPPLVEEHLFGNYSIERLSPYLQRVTRLDGPLHWNQTFTIACGRKDPFRNLNFTEILTDLTALVDEPTEKSKSSQKNQKVPKSSQGDRRSDVAKSSQSDRSPKRGR
jgi:hypothetical protein